MLPAELGFASAFALNDTDARLVWELAAEISKPAEILKRYGLTAQDLKAKTNDKMFIAALREAKNAWKSDLNVQQRVRLKAALLLEDSLVDILMIIKTPEMSAVNKLEATKQLASMGDVGPRKTGSADPGSGFKLVINLGDNSPKSVTIDGHALPAPAATADAE